MAIYRFRVTFEDYDDVYRDIEIRATHTFEDLHHAIHNSIGFDASKPASFFLADDNWKKGKEISSRLLDDEEKESVMVSKKSRLCDSITDPHQKFYYLFDKVTPWGFRIELIKIIPQEEALASYPRCVKVVGDAPKQYGAPTIAELPLPEDFDPDAELMEEEIEEEETLEVEAEDLPEGEEKVTTIVSENGEIESLDELETADEDMIDEEGSPESEEF